MNRLLSKDIPYVWYARTVWAIGAQPKVQNFNNPTTPGGQQGLRPHRRGHLAPADLAVVAAVPGTVVTDDRPARSGRGGRVMIGP